MRSELDDLGGLEEKLWAAVKNATETKYLADIEGTLCGKEEAKDKVEAFADIKDEEYIEFGEYSSDLPNEVSVGCPENYEFLLKKAHVIYADIAGKGHEKIDDYVKVSLKHELAHAKQGMNEKRLMIRYGVSFYVDNDEDLIIIGANLRLYGALKKKTYLQMLDGADDKSYSDKFVAEGCPQK